MVKQIECEDAEASKENKMLKCEEEEDYFLSVIHSHCLGLWNKKYKLSSKHHRLQKL